MKPGPRSVVPIACFGLIRNSLRFPSLMSKSALYILSKTTEVMNIDNRIVTDQRELEMREIDERLDVEHEEHRHACSM